MDTPHLKTIEQRPLCLSHRMIRHTNHVGPKAEGIENGRHYTSSASALSIMTALSFSALRPRDRVAAGRMPSASSQGRSARPLRLIPIRFRGVASARLRMGPINDGGP